MTRQRAILNFLDEMSSVSLHGFRLGLDGQCLAEGYWSPYRPEEPHRLYSVSKSVTSLAIGILAGEGKLRLEDLILDHFPEFVDEDTPALLREVTIRHMLMMATCYERTQYAIPMADWTRPFFHGNATHPAGTLFHYDTSASQVLCALVTRLSGTDTLSFVEDRLFRPLGMDGPKTWLRDGMGVCQGGTGLSMTLRDFSRLADFCMSDGMGLVPAWYLREATSRQIDTSLRSAPEERHGYGYQFWQMRRGFAMYGMGGQMGLCLPEQKLSLCTFGDTMFSSTGVQPIYDAFFRHLDGIAALPSDDGDQAELDARLLSLRLTPVEGSAAPRALRLTLAPATLPFSVLDVLPDRVVFHLPDGPAAVPFATGDWAQGIFPTTDLRCITSAAWQEADRFLLRCEVKDTFTCGIELHLSLRDQFAALRVNSSARELRDGWAGLAQGHWTAL